MIYSHSDHKVARSLRKAKRLCYGDRTSVGNERLDDKNEGNNGKVRKLVSCKLGG